MLLDLVEECLVADSQQACGLHVEAQQLLVLQDHEALDDVLELADVARSVVTPEPEQRLQIGGTSAARCRVRERSPRPASRRFPEAAEDTSACPGPKCESAEETPSSFGIHCAVTSKARLTEGLSMATKYGKKASEKVERAMHERKRGTLRSGRSGKKVTSRKQAIAIGLSEARQAGAKVPRKRKRS